MAREFYSDPADKIATDLVPTDRLKYMTEELSKNGAAHNAEIVYLKTPMTIDALSKGDLLFIHVPSRKLQCLRMQRARSASRR